MKIYYRLRNKIFRSFKHWTIRKTILTVVVLLLLVLIGTKSLHYIELRHWDNRLGELYEPLIPATYIPNITNLLAPWRYFEPSNLPQYRLKISAKDQQKLDQAIPTGFDAELPDSSAWVPATFYADGKKYDVKVKNRGLLPSHWKYREKSWHIKFTKETFHGYTELNFILPEEKNFLVEDYGYHVARKLGLVTLDSSFARMKINNQAAGVYWVVEQWDAGFLERHQLSADTNFYFGEKGGIFVDASNWQTYTTSPNWKQPNYADMDILIRCFVSCSDQEFAATAGRIIDLDNFARWQAQASILGDTHQDYFHNNRFYFNSAKGKFQFFPWDVSQFDFKGQLDINYNPLVSRMLTIPAVVNRRNQLIWEYVNNPATIADDLAYYQQLWQTTKSAFYRDRIKRYSNWYVSYQVNDRYQKIKTQYQYLKDLLAGSNDGPVAIKLLIEPGLPNGFSIIANNFSDLSFRGVRLEQNLTGASLIYDANSNGKLDPSDPTLARFFDQGDDKNWQANGFKLNLSTKRQVPVQLERLLQLVPTTYRFFIVAATPADIAQPKITFDVANAVTGAAVKTQTTFYDFTTFARLSETDQPVDTFIVQNPMFKKTNNNELLLSAGQYQLSRTVIVPSGTKLTIAPGATISFDPGVSLISYSPINASGTVSQPITFKAAGKQPWGVVGIVESGPSSFAYCHFSGGKDALLNGTYFSGMFDSYYTDITFDHCLVEGAQADDGINIKHAKAAITHSEFRQQSADAIDLDYVNGVVQSNIFVDNGNDSVDISGSKVRIEGNLMRGSGDKGVSVGEQSEPIIVNNLMVNNHIGIEVKDLSKATIGNVTLSGNQIGINEYQKKDIFGGGSATVYNSIIWGNGVEIQLDELSSITVASSIVKNGWKGEKIIELDPKFKDPGQIDFTITNTDAAIKAAFDASIASQYEFTGAKNIGVDPGLVTP